MKKMPKELFDNFIELSRNYWEIGERSILDDRMALSFEIKDVTGVDWLCIQDLVDSIIRCHGFKNDAENETIYEVLRVLGWEVKDENTSSECR